MKTQQREEAPEGVAGGKIVELNEAVIKEHLNTVDLSTMEETLNLLLDAEADRLCKAGCYERKEERADTRAGSYRRKLQTKAGEVSLKVPKLRSLPFETAIIERYKRRGVLLRSLECPLLLADPEPRHRRRTHHDCR